MQVKAIRVLLIDDDPIDAELTQRALSQAGGPRLQIDRAASLAEAANCLGRSRFDVALLDLGLLDSPRAETLDRFCAICTGDLPIIVLTGIADDESALESLDHGVRDYPAKDEVTADLLSRSVRYAMQRHHLLGQLNITNELFEQKNQRLAQFYETAQQFENNVSHEFRTSLTVIREFTSIIRDGLDGSVTARQAEHLERIIHRTDDLALMVDDMLNISKLEAGLLGVWRRPCHVSELIETVCGLLTGRAKSKHISLTVEAPRDLPEVFCDEEKARRVIVNLAVNAIKFTPDGGTVRIWAKAGGDHDVVIGVSDSGPGISRENLELIFHRFQQVDQAIHASTKGFGLGLNIAKELVALNLGRISVESAVGAGSTFSFTLPVNDPGAVFDRYLDRIAGSDNRPAAVSLLSVQFGNRTRAEEAAPLADEFLQRSVRANDIVLQRADGRWIIAAACTETACGDMIQRLTADWAGFNRNCPQTQLPQLAIQLQTTCALPGERHRLTNAFLSSIHDEVPAAPPSSKTRRMVLVVDDNREMNHCLTIRLRAAGYDVTSAVDGDEGLVAALANLPDAIVLDVRMPKKDGLTVLQELRRQKSTRQTPIVMLSGSIRDQHRALEAGANYFVRKPYDVKEILTAIDSSLRKEVAT